MKQVRGSLGGTGAYGSRGKEWRTCGKSGKTGNNRNETREFRRTQARPVLIQARRSHRQRRLFVCDVEQHAAGLQMITISVRRARLAPNRADVNLAIAPGNLSGLAALFLHVGLDDLRRRSGGKIAVLAFFQQRAHDDLRIASWFDAHKPTIVLEVLLPNRSELGLQSIADGLRAAGFSGEVDPLQVSTRSGSAWRDYIRHGIGNGL